jgi:hypothetical protein
MVDLPLFHVAVVVTNNLAVVVRLPNSDPQVEEFVEVGDAYTQEVVADLDDFRRRTQAGLGHLEPALLVDDELELVEGVVRTCPPDDWLTLDGGEALLHKPLVELIGYSIFRVPGSLFHLVSPPSWILRPHRYQSQ